MSRPAAFLDRDGVLNIDRAYVHTWREFEWIEGAREAIQLLNRNEYWVFIVTNQSGVARNLFSISTVEALHRKVSEDLALIGARIDSFRICPYHPDFPNKKFEQFKDWRKPAPGMIVDLCQEFVVDIKRSFLVGDKDSDIEAAESAGIRPYKFEQGNLYDFLKTEVPDLN